MSANGNDKLSLCRFSIEGLRGVGQVELTFQPDQRVYTLFGSNGIGKTKCLEVIYQLLMLTCKTFSSFKGPGRIALESSCLLAEKVSNLNNLTLSRQTAIGAFMLDFGVHETPIVLLGAKSRSSLSRLSSVAGQLGTFDQRRQQFLQHQLQSFQKADFSDSGMSMDVLSWFVTRAQSVNPYQKQADNRSVEIETVLEMLHELDQRIDSKVLQIDGAGRVFIQVSDRLCGLDELSSGFTSLVKMIQAIVSGYAAFTNEVQLRHVRGVVLIDEIESHLHAEWQAKIIPKLKALLPNTTFFIATHSPLVLAQLQEGEAYLLKRDPHGVVCSELIRAPNRKSFADMLENAFGINLNNLKRESLDSEDQSRAKQALLDLLRKSHSAKADT